jgi:hypothetical protein
MISNYPFEQELRQKSASGDAVLTTGYADDYIIRGYGFNVQRRLAALAAASVTKLVFDTTAVTSTSLVFTLPLVFAATGGPVLVRTYKITTYTGGTAWDSNKLNYLTTNTITASSVVKYGITSTDTPGTDLREYVLGATGNEQQVNRSGAASATSPIMLQPGTKICVEITNNYGSAIDFVMGLVWYELPVSSPATTTSLYSASNTAWTAITSAGQNGVCFLVDSGLVLIDHSTTGTGGCADNKAIRLNKIDSFQNNLFLRASSNADIFYVKAMSAPIMSLAVQLN